MSESPRNILLRNRPVRQALLLDLGVWNPAESRTEVFIDEFVARSHGEWEGLATPLILHRGNNVEEEDWALLRLSDPDHVRASAPVTDDLLNRIDQEISPAHVEVARVYEDRASFDPIGISILPREEVMTTWAERPLLVFDLQSGCDPIVRRFVERNFGAFAQWENPNHPEGIRRLAGVEHLLQKIPIEKVQISDRTSLATFLDLAAGTRPGRGVPFTPARQFVALCELGGRRLAQHFLRGSADRRYLIQIGDTPGDFACHWNTMWWSGNLASPYKNQLWIPVALAQDPALHDAFNNWLRAYSTAGNSNAKEIVVVSESVAGEVLEPICRAICQHPTYSLRFHVMTSEARNRERQHIRADLDYTHRLRGSEADVYRRILHGSRGVVDVPLPTPLGIEKPEGTWMVDVQVEQLTPMFSYLEPFHPWLLPKCASRMAQFIFQAPARINGAKTFSVEVNRSSLPFGGQPKPEVRLQLPPETDVVRWILTAERGNWARPQDPRAKVPLPQSILREARFSDKGKLMEGMLGLFGGLFETDQFLGRPFWQRLFRELAALDPKRDEILINETQNVLVKAFRGLDIERNRLEQAAKLVASRLSGRAQGQYRTLRQCERLRLSLAKTEKGQGHFAAGSTRTIIIRLGSFDRPRMLSEFDGLIARRVLRLGTALPCPRCGVTDWRSLDTLEQVTRCPGCDHEITVPMNQQGSVTLNSLVRMAVAQGVLGVIQAVSALGQRSESLFFMPSSNLYRSGEANPWREVDVAAIVNGELLLGEVKEGRIGPSDFDGLVEVAEVLRPAKAVLFIKQEEWRAELQTPFDAAKLRLAGHGVGLEVHHLIIV